MIRANVVALVLLGTLTAFGQKPAADTKAPPPKPAATDTAKPAATPTPPAAPNAGKAATPEQVKELKDALNLYQLDELSIQTAQGAFVQIDPVAKKAMAILTEAMASAPEVKKAKDQSEVDRKALLAKIDELRKSMGLDASWDWDFNQGKFVQGKPTPAAPTAPKPPSHG